MAKIGYLFSGQGSQFPGMGSDLYQAEPKYQQVIDTASEVLNIDLSDLSVIDDPNNVQVAILAMSYGIYQTIVDDFPMAQGMIGLSLGEYSALTASQSLDFSQGISLVHDRSHYMDEAGQQNPGAMAAVLKINPQKVIEICNEVTGAYPANFNTTAQTVIGGTKSGVKTASEELKAAGAKRVVPLKVAVASHTPLMQPASDQLAKRLQTVEFNNPVVPVISNTTTKPFTAANVKATLRDQLIKPTHFSADLEELRKLKGFDTLIEIGPGETLSRFAKKTLQGIKTYHIDSVASLQQVREELKTED
ncbi:ACP S-malonyltransferase [Fructilactobacillus lindneri]|uniref:Malonyl CoA-acyl carrier protein transacylase n=2 Tax=Fructilactobacillus lindneri TaxID=53444 RepID=A0A0R2JNK8_9LACO|nr:ACP S-malonyltransferase [Fructilactobacillus lindneri]ANZ57802.1 ACP S-malonyltransferase [Fructilactobacillus lindneri]ANZ59071.1 ACP S-malonyltransferase [Fructilactobacillus lindneri]KRN78751.1 hypothetical protein IV52_GL001029 [Fructilactobacillus lindneri DSM 20690 = JCM 11027]POG98125.1 ACP S-malonyltransferase [Fructilactobacillus lindneri]POH01760.1 ACP S-malonyltransferase [Fructilactobacillus lindneri]